MMEELYMQVRVKEFVRSTLGCQCPEDVFDNVDCVDNFTAAGGSVVKARINVGNRLLVYVVEVSRKVEMAYVSDLLREGMVERDARGFNRFRLALCTDDRDSVLSMIKDISPEADGNGSSMETAMGLDERVHVHVLPSSSF